MYQTGTPSDEHSRSARPAHRRGAVLSVGVMDSGCRIASNECTIGPVDGRYDYIFVVLGVLESERGFASDHAYDL